MAGTTMGGQMAAITNKVKYGEDFYAKIGAIGGKNGHKKGFYVNRELARQAGRKGGKVSKRRQRFIGLDRDGAPQYQRAA